jgi:flagellar motility protein MotE (MotC chaperone)
LTDETEINKPSDAAPEPEGQDNKKAKSPIMKYALFGGGGLVLILAIAFGVAMLMGGGKSQTSAESDNATEAAEAPDSGGTDNERTQKQYSEGSIQETGEKEMDSILAAQEDAKVIDNIMDNLAFLEYEPELSEIESGVNGMSVEDSLEKVNWLEQETAKLAERKAELDERERELTRLDAEVTKKLLKLEQAETARINTLARLYDGMEPRAVAKLMANLDDETIVSILPRMKSKNASAVLALLPPQRGARLSKQMITIAEE